MNNILKTLIVAAFLFSSFLFIGESAEAAKLSSMLEIKESKLTRISDEKFDTLYKGAQVSSIKSMAKKVQKYLLKRKKTFTLTLNSTNVDTDKIYDAIGEIDSKKTSDDADFLKGGILSLGWSGYYNSKGQTVTYWKIVYTETAKQVKKVNASAKKVLKKLKVSGMSDVAKVKTIHDYVVNLVRYDDSLKDHSAYGGLTAKKHSTVCQGYALIMYKLLTDAGVPCHYVTGDAGGPHAWNIVKINKKWYHLDATWDDPSDALVYDYFLIGSNRMNNDHKTDKYYTKKYKISTTDLDWVKLIEESKDKDDKDVPTEQTDEEIEKGKDALEREDFIKQMDKFIDQTLGSDKEDQTTYEKAMLDCCKKIYGFIIQRLPDATFEALKERDDMADVYLQDTFALIQQYIINPSIKHIGDDDYTEVILKKIIKDFDTSFLKKLSDDEIVSLFETYMYEDLTKFIYKQIDAYSEGIISTITQTLNEMV